MKQEQENNTLQATDFEDDPDAVFKVQVRQKEEIYKEMDKLIDQVWYNRCWKTLSKKEKTEKVLQAAKNVEEKYGIQNLGPWTDFEWGMINGKLSALRWVLGDDWDMLDT